MNVAPRMSAMSSGGTTPRSHQAWQAAISTRSHSAKALSSDHTRFMSGSEYRSITMGFLWEKWDVNRIARQIARSEGMQRGQIARL